MGESKTVLFLCPHNAAKSVLAAADCDRLVRERGLPYRADSAGTEPDDGPAPAVVAGECRWIDLQSHPPEEAGS